MITILEYNIHLDVVTFFTLHIQNLQLRQLGLSAKHLIT